MLEECDFRDTYSEYFSSGNLSERFSTFYQVSSLSECEFKYGLNFNPHRLLHELHPFKTIHFFIHFHIFIYISLIFLITFILISSFFLIILISL